MKQAVLGALVFVTGCATPYHGGMLGKGADAKWVSDDMLVVTAAGNAFTSKDSIAEFCALKAAEETINAGYRYMVVTKTVNVSQNRTHYVQTRERAKISAISHGNRVSRSAESDAPFGETILIEKPGQRVTFQLYKEQPEGLASGQYQDAYETYNALGPAHLKEFTPVKD